MPTNNALEHIKKLLHSAQIPELPPELEDLRELHQYLVELRIILKRFSAGDFSQDVKLRGIVAGCLKTMQASLLHLAWQIKQVAQGDFTQRVDFLGDFSDSFNRMVVQLDSALTSLKQKETELLELTRSLEHEVEQRGQALHALQESETHFRYLAEHDALTSILNRRSFFSLAEMELRRMGLMNSSCCLALLDVDKFKNFNDTYGHLNGDEALKHVTKVAQQNLRQSDIIGRYGGEEFVFFFGAADINQGTMAAERIRRSIETTPVKLSDSDVPITVSIGLVPLSYDQIKAHRKNIIPLALEKADEALYKAKSEGRNRVCIGSL